MLVPILPGVRAGVLLVGVVEGVAGQGLEEVARRVRGGDGEVLAALGVEDARAGEVFVQYALRGAHYVLLGALEGGEVRGAVGDHHARGALGIVGDVAFDRARGQAADGRVVLGIGKADLHTALAAHGQAGDEVVLALVGQREHGAHDGGQLLGDVGVVLAAVLHVRVGGQVRVGHDHRKTQRRGVALDGGAALPDGVVIAGAVQQPQRGVLVAGGNRRHADLPGGALGQDHVARNAHAQRFREEIDMNECHDALPPYFLMGSQESTVWIFSSQYFHWWSPGLCS